MNGLIQENISWEKLEKLEHAPYTFAIRDAYISRESRALTIVIGLNFIVPYEDDRRIRRAVIESLDGLTGIELRYEYDKDNMALSKADIAALFVPRWLSQEASPLANAADLEHVGVEDGRIVVATFGRYMTERMNRLLAPEIARSLSETFGFSAEIVFRHDEGLYAEAEENLKGFDAPGTGDDIPSDAECLEDPDESGAEEPVGIEMAAGSAAGAVGTEAAAAGAAGKAPGGNAPDGRSPAPRRRRTAAGAGTGKGAARSGKTSGNGGARGTNFQPVLGRAIRGESRPMNGIEADDGMVIAEGTLFHIESRPVKKNSLLVHMLVTDHHGTVCLKGFFKEDRWQRVSGSLSEGDYIRFRGETEWDRFDQALAVKIRDIEKGEAPRREDTCEKGRRVELHCHTKMSAMDGLNDPDVIVKKAARWGQPAVAITDHGVVQSFPDAANTAAKLAKKGTVIKVLYGLEGYYFDDRDRRREDGSIDYKTPATNHIILLVRTQAGMKNLYRLVSSSHLNYFHKRPRIPRSLLDEYREGLIVGSACEAGEVYRAVERDASDEELERIAAYYDYLEIQPLVNNHFLVEKGVVPDEETLRAFNRRIVELGDRLGKPVVATTDAHYDEPESAIYRNILMKGMGFRDAENGKGLYLRTTDEMLEEFSYLGEETAERVVITNTNVVADWIDEGIKPVPDEKYPPKIEGAEETLRTTCETRAREIYGDPLPPEIEDRLETELNAIINNGYAVMYVSAQMLVKKSLEDGYLVGSRGSVGSSFAATMAGITEVNPLDPHYICPKCKHLEWGDKQKYDCGTDMPEKACPECGTMMRRDGYTIPFATFLGFNGNKEPDIDLNFASDYQARAHKYVGVIFGEENVYKAGTVGTLAEKTAYGYVRNFFEETGWPVSKYEVDRLTLGCTGVKRTTGQHPGGIIIVPRDHEIYEFCPVQRPANDVSSDIVTTHFDYHKIDKNLLKLDILGHTIPSMIRQLQDMTGVDPMKIDLTDKKVLSIFNGTEALDIKDPDYPFTHGTYGIPEFGTNFTRNMLDDVKPSRFEDLIRMSGFSHGTDVWKNNAQDYIRSGTATMREVISTRDDIMNFCILHGIENDVSFRIMEDVRKKDRILTDEDIAAMKEHDIPDWYIESCGKIKYMFPRAHAVAYVMMSFRIAWFKVYYPAEFYATYFSSVIADFNADAALGGAQAVWDRMDAVHKKGKNATAKEKDELIVLEVIYEMFARGYEFLPAELGISRASRFWVKDGKILLPLAVYPGVGENAAAQIVEAYEERPFETIEDLQARTKAGRNVVDVLKSHGVLDGIPEKAQISFSIC